MRLRFATTALVAVAMAFVARPAEATALMIIDDPSTAGFDVVVADETAAGMTIGAFTTTNADVAMGTAGFVLYFGAVSTNWFLTSDTGTSKPVLGGPTEGSIDITYNANSQGAGTLDLYFLDTDFLLPGQDTLGIMLTNDWVYQSFVGSATAQGCINTANNYSLTGTNCLATQTLPASGASALSGWISPFAGSFALVERITITHTAGGISTGNKQLLAVVPEPGSLILLGGGLLGLAGVVRRRFRSRT